MGLPQDAQTYGAAGVAGGGGACKGAAAVSSGTLTRHLLQNLSPGLMGFPHALQLRVGETWAGTGSAAKGDGGCERRVGGGGLKATGGGGAGNTVAAEGTSGTLTRHLLQNLSPGLMGFPHALQVREISWTGSGFCTGGGGGNVAGAEGLTGSPIVTGPPHEPQNFISGVRDAPQDRHCSARGCGGMGGAAIGAGAGSGEMTGVGVAFAAALASPDFVPQIPQNFSSWASGLPQELQVSGDSGATAGGALAAGGSSIRDAPQLRQNFCVTPTFFPHSGQNGMIISHRK